MCAALPVRPGRVDIRCEDCARDLGSSAPTLVVAARDELYSGGWELINIGPRRPQARPGPRPIRGLVTMNTAAGKHGRAVNQHHARGRSVELACRRCKRRARRQRRALVELAAATSGAGRGDAYLSLA